MVAPSRIRRYVPADTDAVQGVYAALSPDLARACRPNTGGATRPSCSRWWMARSSGPRPAPSASRPSQISSGSGTGGLKWAGARGLCGPGLAGQGYGWELAQARHAMLKRLGIGFFFGMTQPNNPP